MEDLVPNISCGNDMNVDGQYNNTNTTSIIGYHLFFCI